MERQFFVYVVLKSVMGYEKRLWVRLTNAVFGFKWRKWKEGLHFLGEAVHVVKIQRAASQVVIFK